MRHATRPSQERSRPRRPVGVRPPVAILLLVILLCGQPGSALARQGSGTPVAVPPSSGVAVVHGLPGPDIGLGGDAPPFAVLTDLTAYLDRDMLAPLEPAGQVIAPLSVAAGAPFFDLGLPAQPRGLAHSFAAGAPSGVQLFSVNVHADLGGSPFLDPWEYAGWPTGYSSVTLTTGTQAINGGSVFVWADGPGHLFPGDRGPDELVLTADDPVTPVEAGWTRVDLSTGPFTFSRDETVTVPIVSGFGAVRDLSGRSYVEAFDALIAELRLRYPFTDHKAIDWDALVATYRPGVVAAEGAGDGAAFNDVLSEMAVAIGDGHLAVSPGVPLLRERIGGSVGLSLARTDRGEIVVTAVDADGPAAKAGLRPGAVVVTWDGQLADTALVAVALVRPSSTEVAAIPQRLQLLPLGPVDTTVTGAFRDPEGSAVRSVALARTADDDAFYAVLGRDAASIADRAQPPVESRLLDPTTGYVRLATFAAAPALLVAAWDHAIGQFQDAGARSLIVDLRGNSGGFLAVATYIAGSFIARPVNLADLSIATDAGEWGVSGKLGVRPNNALWSGSVTVLVDSGCISACEVLAAALAANPATVVTGSEATGGVVATVFFWYLPGGNVFQAPLGRFTQRDGVWLEGVGVTPDLRVPVTVASITSGEDTVLQAARAAER